MPPPLPHSPAPPLLSFLTDFGLQDTYVGQVKAAILSVRADLVIVDLTHQVPPQDVQEGAFQLMAAVNRFPRGSVHLAVVDPGVGTARRGVAVQVGGCTLVGPDNGLLSPAVLRLAAESGSSLDTAGASLELREPVRAVDLTEDRFWRHPVAPTFHARDVFGPVAAHLAAGTPLEALGRPLERLVRLPFFDPPRQLSSGRYAGKIVQVDRFGNLTTNLPASLVRPTLRVQAGEHTISGLQPTYGFGSEPIALIGSAGYLELALPGGSAAAHLGLSRGDSIEVELS